MLQQRAKKCIELSVEHVINPEFAVACFLPGRAKDLTASAGVIMCEDLQVTIDA
jgi:hypothetical protein